MPHARLLAVSVPGLLVAVLFALSAIVDAVSGQPLVWPAWQISLSQAVIMSDQAEVIRQLEAGVDPNGRYEVGEVLRPGERYLITPLEAAVLTREVVLIELVVRRGAIIDERNDQTLQCFARSSGSQAILEYLIARGGKVAPCDGVTLPVPP